MINEDKNKQQANSKKKEQDASKLQTSKIINLSENVREATTRFENLSKMTNDLRNILDKPGIDWLLNGITLDDSEITSLSLWIHSQFKAAKTSMKPADIAQRLRIQQDFDNTWRGRNYVGERDGQIFVQIGKQEMFISNLILSPLYTVTVDKGNKYHVYNVHITNDSKTYTLRLSAQDFNKLEELQKRIKEQLSHTSASINRGNAHMEDLRYRYIDLSTWEHNKRGTSLIGLERLDADGPKYFCTPNAIYNLDGNKSEDIMYMGNEQANEEEVRKLMNLDYNLVKWPKIAKQLLKSIIKLNSKESMLAITGWMGAIPHDYVIRKEAGTNFFPHNQIVAEPGAGKSTLVQLLKQFMGHNDAAPKVFPSPAETQKLLNSSYTIPAILDEYGKRWDDNKARAIDGILVECFTKAGYSKGKSDQSSIYYKYKNPVMIMGQVGPKDGALATRIVPVYLYKSFHNSKKGKEAFKALNELNKMNDKNFWTGYNLWCAKHTNQEVETQYDKYRSLARELTKDSRVADIQAIVMLGLHYMHKLALELGISEDELGYTLQDIDGVPHILNEVASATETDDVSPLTDFLQAVASFGRTHGNSQVYGTHFGRGYNVMIYKPTHDGAGVYDKHNKREACVFGNECIAIKVKEIAKVLNRMNKNNGYDINELMTFIESAFREAKENEGKGLVLAPKQFRVTLGKGKYAEYTLFNKEYIINVAPDFDNLDL